MVVIMLMIVMLEFGNDECGAAQCTGGEKVELHGRAHGSPELKAVMGHHQQPRLMCSKSRHSFLRPSAQGAVGWLGSTPTRLA